MIRFPRLATLIGLPDRLMQESDVGPQDDDGNEDDGNDAVVLIVPEES